MRRRAGYKNKSVTGVSSLVYDQSLDIKTLGLPSTFYRDLVFNEDYSKLYAVGDSKIYQIDLSEAGVLSSGTYSSLFLSALDDSWGVFISKENDKIYAGRASVRQYNLSDPNDVSSGVSTSKILSTDSAGFCFSLNGDYLYSVHRTNNTIQKFTLATSWDISTATLTQTKDVSSQSISNAGIRVFDDGGSFIIIRNSGVISSYSADIPYDVSSIELRNQFQTSTQMQGIEINENLNKIYTINSEGVINQYSYN